MNTDMTKPEAIQWLRRKMPELRFKPLRSRAPYEIVVEVSTPDGGHVLRTGNGWMLSPAAKQQMVVWMKTILEQMEKLKQRTN